MARFRIPRILSSAKVRNVMGVQIGDSDGKTIMDRVGSPTALVPETRPLKTQHIKDQIMAKMAVKPAARKSGTLPGGDGSAGKDRTIGPPDARIVETKTGATGIILFAIAVITVLMLFRGRAS